MSEKKRPRKPTGKTGPISIGPAGVRYHPFPFPETKEEIENLIAGLFEKNAGKNMPLGLAPFTDLKRNPQDDLDFTITSQKGTHLLELAEFAPLQELGVSYDEAPRQMGIGETADLACKLIGKKSIRQGGAGRLLLLYTTHAQFFIPPPAQELVRRRLCYQPPAFDAVYFLSPHDADGATVFEIWPGSSHPFFRGMSDDKLSNMRITRVSFDDLEE